MDAAKKTQKLLVADPPRERAAFATMSRLISCLVTEQIIPAFYIPLNGAQAEASGFMFTLFGQTTSNDSICDASLSPDDIFAIVPLQHQPIFKENTNGETGCRIGLVDPMDMLPFVYWLTKSEAKKWDEHTESILSSLPVSWELGNRVGVCRVQDPLLLWRKFSETQPIDEKVREAIENEIKSSFHWQIKAYENPPTCPSLHSPSIEWEQSLVTGHPTHPMHRARVFNQISLEYDWYHPRVRFVRVPRTDVRILGQFEKITKRLAALAAKNTSCPLDVEDTAFIYMPVHELQVENIKARFGNVELLDPEMSLPAQAQASIRTVEITDFPGIAIKLAVGVRISSGLRTISHYSADFGPRFSQDIVPRLAVNPEILHVELETSGAVYVTPDPEIASHFTAIIREKYEAPKGQTVIVVAALLDMGHAGLSRGVSVVEKVFDLDSDDKKEAFLDRFIQLACRALIPPLIVNGVCFEAHAQNVQARFDAKTKELQGFVVRDLAGLRVHPPTLRNSTGVDFQFLDGHVVATKSLEDILPKFYHTFVHNLIQRLIRILGMHYNGRGWEMLRKHMTEVIPKDHAAWKLWMDPASQTVDSKCLMRMRIRDSYRDIVSLPLPNLIQYLAST